MLHNGAGIDWSRKTLKIYNLFSKTEETVTVASYGIFSRCQRSNNHLSVCISEINFETCFSNRVIKCQCYQASTHTILMYVKSVKCSVRFLFQSSVDETHYDIRLIRRLSGIKGLFANLKDFSSPDVMQFGIEIIADVRDFSIRLDTSMEVTNYKGVVTR